MGEASAMSVFLQDRMVFRMLRPYERSHAKEFPAKKIIDVSVRNNLGVSEWFALLDQLAPGSAPAMNIDYDIYADGEALLGWLNATIELKSKHGVDSAAVLQSLAHEMKSALGQAEIAHLKMTLSPDDALAGEIAALSHGRLGGLHCRFGERYLARLC